MAPSACAASAAHARPPHCFALLALLPTSTEQTTLHDCIPPSAESTCWLSMAASISALNALSQSLAVRSANLPSKDGVRPTNSPLQGRAKTQYAGCNACETTALQTWCNVVTNCITRPFTYASRAEGTVKQVFEPCNLFRPFRVQISPAPFWLDICRWSRRAQIPAESAGFYKRILRCNS